ncbi:Winged helix DNA-binding domain-containing protein [Nonomuraea solani]|uniref:Winged helix DNA-binding domain-containing protein n=1 Tax=Nonomuraea solani TaxID=1144553 RepID=A0A1H5W179_9ACTN|nr:winged helix DNA-binding domain-containing protein [Nonomuraea solani]SEF93038.1 Winged helix DNA-binding domain-containing protein [Nonomuraea solani]
MGRRAAVTLDGLELAHRRTGAVGLGGAPPVPFAGAAEVVGWFGALQSQDYHPAKWAVAQRLGPGVTDVDLDRAFDDGVILRTHVLRPTWHFVAPADLRWLLELTAPRVHVLNAYAYRRGELDGPLLRRTTDLIADAVAGANHLTRTEIAALLARHGILAERFRLGYILIHAELERVICSGPLRGRRHTYALLDERVPRAASLEREAALAELVRRFFTSHGPATAKDLAWWSSLTLADIATGLSLAGDALENTDVDGVTYWSAPGDAPAPAGHPSVRLLQAYDEYIVGYRQSKHLLDLGGLLVAAPDKLALPNGVIVVDTQVAGRWRRTVRAGAVVLEAVLYRPFGAAETAALHAAADELGVFLGARAVVSVSLL